MHQAAWYREKTYLRHHQHHRELQLDQEVEEEQVWNKVRNQYQIHDSFSGVQHNTGYIIEDNFQKDGWYVHNLKTDIQEGTIREFAKKENKWFDYIKGVDKGGGDNLDTGDFSLQGLGFATTIL